MRDRLDSFLKRRSPDLDPTDCIGLLTEIADRTPRGNLYRAQLLLPFKGDERIDASLLLDDLLDEKRAYFERYNQLNLLEVRG